MRKRNFIILTITIIAAINVILNVRIGNELVDISSFRLEALANDESSSSSSNGRGPLYKSGCLVFENVIVGYHSDGTPNIQNMPYNAEKGDCGGMYDYCTPYKCTKFY